LSILFISMMHGQANIIFIASLPVHLFCILLIKLAYIPIFLSIFFNSIFHTDDQ
jgi:hypothetical protein